MNKLPAPTMSTLGVTSTIAELHGAWHAWTKQVDPVDRKLLADMVRKHNLTSYTGVAALSQDVMGALFEGTLSPAVALAARPWIELMLYSISQATPAADQPRTIAQVVGEMRDKANKKPKPVYTKTPAQLEDNDLMDADEVRERDRVRAEEG